MSEDTLEITQGPPHDPLFTGDVNQCDFFTVRSDSPAAKLGFVNITKPSLWTPGCNTEDVVGPPQFYHW